ncbi:MAG: hypothetical protein OQK63_10690, partial [Ignavibacteriaceae bacterium]|nr:hypothetical protein [Ignavibacteriaceae bacterium]
MKTLIFLISIFIITNLFSQTPSQFGSTKEENYQSIDAYIGDWVGTGWGWEIRFKQSAGDFGKQFVKGKINLPFENEKIIMSLMVTHTTHFYLNIDEN